MMGLDPVIQALCPIRVDTGRGVHFLPHPTVAQALVLQGILPYFEDETYADRIRHVLKQWLPQEVLESFKDIGWEMQCGLVVQFLQACEPDIQQDHEVRDGIKSRELDISLLLAEYRIWYRCDPLKEPWAFFLEQARVLDKAKANVELSNVSWYVSAKDTKQFEKLITRAGLEDAAPAKEELKEPEWFDVNAEVARAAAFHTITPV